MACKRCSYARFGEICSRYSGKPLARAVPFLGILLNSTHMHSIERMETISVP